MPMSFTEPAPAKPSRFQRTRSRFFGLSLDDIICYYFRGNAAVAAVVLLLIIVFLFREGSGFFGQNLANLRIYRCAGLEYVDFVRRELDQFTGLTRELNALRMQEREQLVKDGADQERANLSLAQFDQFASNFADSAEELRGIVSDLSDLATDTKQRDQIYHDNLARQQMLRSAGKNEEAAAGVVAPVDFDVALNALRATFPAYQEAHRQFADRLATSLSQLPSFQSAAARSAFLVWQDQVKRFLATFPQTEKAMMSWDPERPVHWNEAFTSFLFGREWITASFWQDFYGLVPLLVGSLLVCLIALAIAVPVGVAAAIYVSQLAVVREKNFIKPVIEFISAIPSVVLGFFGVAVLGQSLRDLSESSWLSWVPGFPMSERLNALTAGCLLAFMAIPTIFSLAEDALNNVPRHLTEGSLALGGTRLQTVFQIIVPTALSGIISAILLGFGRVIGETMVVLLCAGNRIAIPDFTQGLGAFFQPVHTMTGIIAQEMGEVVPGSIHYRALFVVGLVLFFAALLINFLAQRIVRRYRNSLG